MEERFHHISPGESEDTFLKVVDSETRKGLAQKNNREPRLVWRAEPMKWHWSGQDSLKYREQSGVTHVNRDGYQSAMALWFEREAT